MRNPESGSDDPSSIAPLKRYLSPVEVEAYTGIPVKTLEDERSKGVGFPFIKRGHRTIKYDRLLIDEMMQALTCRNTAQSVAMTRAGVSA